MLDERSGGILATITDFHIGELGVLLAVRLAMDRAVAAEAKAWGTGFADRPAARDGAGEGRIGRDCQARRGGGRWTWRRRDRGRARGPQLARRQDGESRSYRARRRGNRRRRTAANWRWPRVQREAMR